MSSYDLKRLETAIQYIRRMSAGRNPVTNRPAPENDVLSNINVHRCLNFIDEVLTDVHKSGGIVGQLPQRERSAKIPLSQTFPYEILQQYRYQQDQQISFFLKQLEEYLPEGQKMPVPATTITGWLRENGYLEKQAVNDTGKENSVPTRKGEALGMYSEKGGIYPNEYFRVFYNENAQRFIIENFRRILTEYEAIRERNRREKQFSAPPQYDSAPIAPASAEALPPASAGALPPVEYPMPAEDLPQEYYDMLSSGWAPSDNEIPW